MTKSIAEILAPKPEALAAVERIEGWRALGNNVIETIINKNYKVFNTEQMNQAVFAFRRYEDASLRYTGIESHEGLTNYGLYDTVLAIE